MSWETLRSGSERERSAAYREPPFAVIPEQLNARNEERQREGERVAAFYANQERERKECAAKEGREAIAREVAERNRRHGWPY